MDLDASIKLTGGNRELAEEMQAMMLKALPDDLKVITESFRESDQQSLLERVHRLHGACQYCAAPVLKQACLTLENSLKKSVPLQNPALHQQVQQVTDAITQLLQWHQKRQSEVIEKADEVIGS